MLLFYRLFKYILNLAGLTGIYCIVLVGFGIIVQLPDCDSVMNVILSVLKDVFFVSFFYLLVVTALNYFIEKRLEKRKNSKEFLVLFFIQILLLCIFVSLISSAFYDECCK